MTDSQDFGMQVYAKMQSLRRYAIKLTGNADRADDLMQDTIVKALRYKTSFETGTKLGAWLLTIMRNVFLADVKKASYRQTYPLEGEAFEIAHPSIHRTAEDRIELQQRLNTLPPFGLTIVADVAVGGYTYAQAAKKYGVCIETVKSRVCRTRRGEYRAGGPRRKRAASVGN